VVAGLAAAYFVARETPLFALRTVDVRGAPPAIAGDVRRALEPLSGTTLVTLDTGDVERRLGHLPVVIDARVDRAFPHTLVVRVRPERAVAIVRRGRDAWVVSARGRVLERLETALDLRLPRIWVPKTTSVALGALLAGDAGRLARALAEVEETALARRIKSARFGADDDLTFVLRSGLELRVGAARSLRLKLDVANQVLATVGEPSTPGYLEVSDPVRPVGRLAPPPPESQVEG
jgi:cell division septal protein FtsQ